MELKSILEDLRKENRYREIRDIERLEGKYLYMGEKRYLDMSSSNYLGYRDDDEIKERAKESIDRYGLGSGASRLVVGSSRVHKELEEYIAKHKNQDRALLFNSGYDANIGVISTLYGPKDVIYCDKLNHASIYDGIKLSGAKLIRYKHLDIKDLEKKIEKTRRDYNKALIVTDTVFSMDGDKARLKELVEIKKRYNIHIMIDEAHGGGVLGKYGMGLAEEQGVLSEIDINMGTFSKAYGSQGAYVAASEDKINYLINFCRSLIFTTSMPPAIVTCSYEAMKKASLDQGKREYLRGLSDYARYKVSEVGLDTLTSETNIIPIIMDTNEEVLKVSKELYNRGIIIPAIRKPTVVKPRLRISLSTNHTKEDIDLLVEVLRDVID